MVEKTISCTECGSMVSSTSPGQPCRCPTCHHLLIPETPASQVTLDHVEQQAEELAGAERAGHSLPVQAALQVAALTPDPNAVPTVAREDLCWAAGPAELSGSVPMRLGRFEIRRFVGQGGFGWVFEAYDPQVDRVIALKVAKPEKLGSPA